jgi:hypothetical protein
MSETTLSMPVAPSHRLRHADRAIAATLALVGLADMLLFGHEPGLSLPLLIVAIAAAIVLTTTRPITARSLVIAAILTIVAVLPLIEAPSIQGVLCALVALSILSLAVAGRLPARVTTLPWKLFGFALLAPFRWLEDGLGMLAVRGRTNVGRSVARQVLVWIIPAVFALVFVWLFSAANPVIETVLSRLDPGLLTQFADPGRMIFWLIVAIVVWPLLVPRLLQRRKVKPVAPSGALPMRESLLFGPAALLRSLIVFNAIFAVQTGLDLTYLWAGAALPDGMTHAEYAHRGAYPLIATALLAAAFVLAAMRPGGAGESNRTIRWLVYAWIGQNILLCISSILRLDLYVAVYSLTELRIAAGIWMGLVAIGLALILARIALRQNNSWLVATNCAALLATLYGCAFVDFSALIADFNVSHSADMGGEGQALDFRYLRDLGPTALPALDRFLVYRRDNPASAAAQNTYADVVPGPLMVRVDLIGEFRDRDSDWRAWSFRNWRLERYLADPAIAVSARSDNKSGDTSR